MTRWEWFIVVGYTILSFTFDPFLVALISVGLIALFVFAICFRFAIEEERSTRCKRLGHDLQSRNYATGERLISCKNNYCGHRRLSQSPDACLEVDDDKYESY